VKSVTGSDGNGGEAARAGFCAPTVVTSDARTMTRPTASRFCMSRIVLPAAYRLLAAERLPVLELDDDELGGVLEIFRCVNVAVTAS